MTARPVNRLAVLTITAGRVLLSRPVSGPISIRATALFPGLSASRCSFVIPGFARAKSSRASSTSAGVW